jgi:hypothetical protein
MEFENEFFIVATHPYNFSWTYSNETSETDLCSFKYKKGVISNLEETLFLKIHFRDVIFTNNKDEATRVDLEPTKIKTNYRIKVDKKYIRHKNSKLYCEKDDNTILFKKDSVWIFVENKIDLNHTFVISRYNEDINWTRYLAGKVIIYNKGKDDLRLNHRENIEIQKLVNTGREGHTYLHHIIENYNHISDVTIFLPASFYFMDYKKNRGLKIIEIVNDTKNSVFPSVNLNGSVYETDYLYHFQLDEWKTSFEGNQENNQENNTNYDTLISPIRPYGLWFEKHFPNNICPYVTYMGMFAISKDDIYKNPVEKYKELISYVDNHVNPEAGHYIERAWVPLFYPFTDESSIYYEF